jgi:hypothetical protein
MEDKLSTLDKTQLAQWRALQLALRQLPIDITSGLSWGYKITLAQLETIEPVSVERVFLENCRTAQRAT